MCRFALTLPCPLARSVQPPIQTRVDNSAFLTAYRLAGEVGRWAGLDQRYYGGELERGELRPEVAGEEGVERGGGYRHQQTVGQQEDTAELLAAVGAGPSDQLLLRPLLALILRPGL